MSETEERRRTYNSDFCSPPKKRRRESLHYKTQNYTRLAELETKVHEPSTLSHAQKLSAKLESLDSEFKVHHYGIIDTIPDDDHVGETMTKEQDELDQHDTNIANLSIRLEELMRKSSSKAESAAY